jgi:antitoxin HicB
MLDYPVELTPDDNGTVLATFPDVPGAVTFGEDDVDALARAPDALETMLAAMIADRSDIPVPSPAKGRPTVSPSLLGTLKIAAYMAMRANGWRKADLARALQVNPRQIDRLLDLRHATPVAHIEAALAVCGYHADVETRRAA